MTTPDPLVIKYLPQLRGHVINKYRWMEYRGNCLITIDDIVQVASIVLMKLADRWDDYLAGEGKTREGNDGLFWSFLAYEVKREVFKFYQRDGKEGVEALDSSFDSEINERGWLESEARTRGAAPRDKIHWGAVRNDIVDYFQTMPLKDKIYIALRYFDEIPAGEAAALVGTSEKTYTNQTASFVSRWRDHATNQLVVDGATRDVAKRVEYAWEPLDILTSYVRDRHRADLHEYVWYVSECFRQDVGYLAAILGKRKSHEQPEGGRTSVTPAQRREINHMLDQNFNCVQISHQLGVSYAAVLWTRDNPRPIR